MAGRRAWTEERRREVSERRRAWWNAKTPEERKAHVERSWAAFAAKHPERVVVIEATRARIRNGEITKQPCDKCGRDDDAVRPVYDWTARAERFVGWRCIPCRKT
jgi:hypothetical protein